MTRPRIAIAKCHRLPEPDPDHEPLVRRLEELGADVRSVSWDAEPPDSLDVDLCVLRATWNYYYFPEQFLAWCREVAATTRLLNPASIVAWNCDKHYLSELSDRGVDVVPTTFLDRVSEDPGRLAEFWLQNRWPRVVVKPVISAASFSTRTFNADQHDEACKFLARQLHTRDMMVQPFIASTESIGEKSIAWIDGEITHAWFKRPRFAGDYEHVEPTSDITAADRKLVERTLADGLLEKIFYARIDLMYAENGQPLLSELELIEPSLHFRFSREALDRFAAGLIRHARRVE